MSAPSSIATVVTTPDKPGRIYLCQPTYSSGTADSHQSFWRGALLRHSPWQGRLNQVFGGRSLLANTFNMFWCHALNLQLVAQAERWLVEGPVQCKEDGKPDWQEWWLVNKELALKDGPWYSEEDARNAIPKLTADNDISYFAMLHDDVCPQDGWLDILIQDLETSGADLMAAVVPIKDGLGLTSTAIDDPTDQFNVERRITMSELERLPQVFTAADCGYLDRMLLANTGCWVCRFDRDWRTRVRFTIDDRLRFKTKDGKKVSPWEANSYLTAEELSGGKWEAEVAPEDWNFSRSVQSLGGKVACTRRVKLNHAGHISYGNDKPWGDWQHDKAFEHKFGGVPLLFGKEQDEEELPPVEFKQPTNGQVPMLVAQSGYKDAESVTA